MTELVLLVASLLLVAACAIFVAAEFSFITVNRNSVEKLAAKGDHNAKGVAQALKNLSTQLSGAQVGITITNLAIGFLAEPAIASLIEGPLEAIGIPASAISGIAIVIGITIATVVTMVFGELVPKNIALSKPMATAKLVQAPQRMFSNFMRHPITFLNNSANTILYWMKITPQEELASARSAQELSSLVRRSAEHGTLPKETALMLERTLIFDELTAVEVMTPRRKMHYVHASDLATTVLHLAKKTGHSRFPVIDKELDDIVGIVHLKHVFSVKPTARDTTLISSIMNQPILVPSSIPLDALLKTLRNGGLQMAVVIDEFGGTDGVVTMEDVLEELVDEVRDEHDNQASIIRQRGGQSWVLSGLLRPDEINEATNIALPDTDEYETVAGLFTEELERMPIKGDSVVISAIDRQGNSLRIKLRVERMDGRRIDRLGMTVLKNHQNKAGEL